VAVAVVLALELSIELSHALGATEEVGVAVAVCGGVHGCGCVETVLAVALRRRCTMTLSLVAVGVTIPVSTVFDESRARKESVSLCRSVR
jgi:hypothetical protein